MNAIIGNRISHRKFIESPNEYCHWCGKTSTWKFKNKEGNQIILCPLCGHKHYRIINGALVRPKILYDGKEIVDVKSFLEKHPELRKDFQKLEKQAEMRFKVSGERWGRDPAQEGRFTYAFASTTSSTSNSIRYFNNTTSA